MQGNVACGLFKFIGKAIEAKAYATNQLTQPEGRTGTAQFKKFAWLTNVALRVGSAEDGAGFFVSGNLMEEVADFVELLSGDNEIGDLIGPFIMKDVTSDLNFSFISGVGALGLDGLRKLVHYVTGR